MWPSGPAPTSLYLPFSTFKHSSQWHDCLDMEFELFKLEGLLWRVSHSSYRSQWKKSCCLSKQCFRAFWALKSFSPNVFINNQILFSSDKYLGLLWRILLYFQQLATQVSATHIDMPVQYRLKFRLMAFIVHEI